MIEPGIYKHYKGNLYEVLYLAHHSETLEEIVVYKALYKTQYGTDSIWVRPLSMFLEEIEVNGSTMKRFTKMQN